MGLGFLSKYTALFQWLCWAIFFILWRPARAQLRRPGLYLALLINLVCALPVLIWNQQNHWVTVGHVAGDAKAGEPWTPSLSHLGDFAGFVGSEALLLNPIFFVAMVWAASVFWRRNRQNPRLVYFFSMGAPLFLVYLLYTFHSRVLPNWIAPSVLPLYCLMVAYWDTRWRLGVRAVKVALIAGLALGLPLVILGHDTQLIGKFTHHFLPINRDPLHRARGWKEVAAAAEAARRQIASEGKPAFIIAAHYRLAGEISFYLPAGARDETAVYCRSSPLPTDQFYFWPGYVERKGQNAVFIMELDRDDPRPRPPPKQLTEEFESVEDMGVREVRDHGRLLWPLQIFACRGLR